jgi:Tol biopolymer transport system component
MSTSLAKCRFPPRRDIVPPTRDLAARRTDLPWPAFLRLALATLTVLPATAPAASHRLSQGLPFSDAGYAPRLSPDGRRLVYLHDAEVDEAFELWSVPVDGGAPVRLSGLLPAGVSVEFYAISPDGARVVYGANQEVTGRTDLYSVPIDGPEGSWIRLNGDLPVGGDVDNFAISADSSYVVYVADQSADEAHDAWSVPISGGAAEALRPTVTPVGAGAQQFTSFVMSPDGDWVLFLADFSVLGKWELWRARVDGTGSPTKLNGPLIANGDVVSARISHDGSRVVYRADQEADEVTELFSVPFGGGAAVKLSGTMPADGDVLGIEISSDDSRVVYLADPLTNDALDVYSVPIAGGTAVKLSGALVPGGSVVQFEIARDGSRVAYRADQQVDGIFEVYSVGIAGGAAVKLNGALTPGGSVDDFEISPDSARVVYRADQETEFASELYSVPLAGGLVAKVSDDLVAGGSVSTFRISPAGDSVVYAADLATDNVIELFRGAITGPGSADIRLSGVMTAGGDIVGSPASLVPHPDGRRSIYLADQEFDGQQEYYVGDPCLFCDGFEGGDETRWNG